MFGKKKKRVEYTDLIWCYSETKTQNLINFLKNVDSQKSLIISSFEENIQFFCDELKKENISFKKLNGIFDYNSLEKTQLIHSSQLLQGQNILLETNIRIVFLEHYPIPEKDNNIIEATKNLFPKSELFFFMSLQDPLLHLFGSERIITLMEKMGMDKNEPIRHTMISKSIENAQKKLGKRVKIDKPNESEIGWYRINMDMK